MRTIIDQFSKNKLCSCQKCYGYGIENIMDLHEQYLDSEMGAQETWPPVIIYCTCWWGTLRYRIPAKFSFLKNH